MPEPDPIADLLIKELRLSMILQRDARDQVVERESARRLRRQIAYERQVGLAHTRAKAARVRAELGLTRTPWQPINHGQENL